MCIIMRRSEISWSFLFTPSLYVTVLNLQDFSLLVSISSALYIGMAKVLCIIDVLDYDGQNSSFSSPSPSNSTPITQEGSHISTKLCGYVGYHNGKRLVIYTYMFVNNLVYK